MRRAPLILLALFVPACTTQPAPPKPYVTKASARPSPAPKPPPTPPTSAPHQPPVVSTQPASLQPCADNLHTFAGLLLQYYLLHKQLPPDLESLAALSAFPDPTPSLSCPISHQRYVYNPTGPTLEGAGHLVIYDAAPVHDGNRWGVAVQQATPDHPLTARVVVIPNSVFPNRQR